MEKRLIVGKWQVVENYDEYEPGDWMEFKNDGVYLSYDSGSDLLVQSRWSIAGSRITIDHICGRYSIAADVISVDETMLNLEFTLMPYCVIGYRRIG